MNSIQHFLGVEDMSEITEIKAREQIAKEYKWDLNDIYTSDEAWPRKSIFKNQIVC